MSGQFIRPPFEPNRMAPCFCGSGRRFKSCCGSLSELREPPQGVKVIHDFLDKKTCDAWVEQLDTQPREALGTMKMPASGEGPMEDRKSADRITDVVAAQELRPAIRQAIIHAYRGVIAADVRREFEWYEDPQVLRYQPGGWYGKHSDSENFLKHQRAWRKTLDRDISVLMYLNDEFDGGDLSFVHFNYTYHPRAGDLVYFPSDNRYMHQAHAVTSGIRWVVVSWAAYADEPKVNSEPLPRAIHLD